MHVPVAVDHDAGADVSDHSRGQKERIHQGHRDYRCQRVPRMSQQTHRHAGIVAHCEIDTATEIMPLCCTIHDR